MPINFIKQCFGASRSLAVSEIGSSSKTRLVVMPNRCDLDDAAQELAFFTGFAADQILVFPDLETLPYDLESPSAFILAKRAQALHCLSKDTKPYIVVTNVNALMMYVASAKHWNDTKLVISVGDKVDRAGWKETLLSMGYSSQAVASWPGHFCIHPHVMDIVPIGPSQPVRLRIKNDVITDIQILDPRNQRSRDSVESVLCMPAREISSSPEAITSFRTKWRGSFDVAYGDPTYDSVSKKEFPAGIEYYTSFFDETPASLFDYLPADHECFVVDGAYEEFDRHWKGINRRYNDLQIDSSRRILPPEMVWFTAEQMYSRLEESGSYHIDDKDNQNPGLTLSCLPSEIVPQNSTKEAVSVLAGWRDRISALVLILNSKAKLEQIKLLALMAKLPFHEVKAFSAIRDAMGKKGEPTFCVVYGNVSEGFYSESHDILYVTEKDIFGHATVEKSDDLVVDDDADINDFLNIQKGDRLVHLKYGIGAFQGTAHLERDGVTREYFKIEYAESANAFVKMEDLDQVSRFGVIEDNDRPLDVLGTESWISDLNNATDGIGHTAASLLRIQRERLLKRGISMKAPSGKYIQFSNEFPFDETPDQKRAIKDVAVDLLSERPMDRVVIGDVGFGKTEIAARAAFIAMSAGYQVVLLVPTTLLAQQHYESLKRRFSSFPEMVIDSLSRNTLDERQALRDMASGKTRLIVGTHRLIQGDAKYQNLGLVIIDEEHKFGVAQKETLRSMRTNINMLALSATPIPRTLSASLMGIRDVSPLNTPPAKRLSIRTYVKQYDEGDICQDIDREMQRSGQVFFVHNSTSTIEDRTNQLRALMPTVRFEYAHGKMEPQLLESIMGRFYARQFDVLVATTIIEIGIDVPNANTIIIERADNFGLAQLHQLRGRVGRSTRQAYCSLLISEDGSSETGSKRLDAMSKASNLGGGSILASHDLEIRGAGEILGEDQSGHIQAIGYPLYLRLLERAVELIESNRVVNSETLLGDKIELEVNLTGLVEESYIEDESVRVSIYKRIASLTKGEQLGALIDEMIDRFGDLPDVTANLLISAQIRLQMRKIGIESLHIDSQGGRVDVSKTAAITPHNLIDFCEKNPAKAQMVGPWSIRFNHKTVTRDDRIHTIMDIMETLLDVEREQKSV
jgi:transcription-repair coupling factor (superfamily II helicase)